MISFEVIFLRSYDFRFIHISQAFDRVWHEGLLFKLKQFLHPTYYVIRYTLYSYLTDRHSQVHYGFLDSNITGIVADVPQGGILSLNPLRHLYIRPTGQPTTPNTLVADYADDSHYNIIQSRSSYSLQKFTKLSFVNGRLV